MINHSAYTQNDKTESLLLKEEGANEQRWGGMDAYANRTFNYFGVAMVLLFMVLSMAQELPIVAIGLILSRSLSVSPKEYIFYNSLIYVPWMLRPLFALLTDCVPIAGLRRRPYLLIGCIGASCVNMAFIWLDTSFWLVCALGLALSVFEVLSEVVLDSMAVHIGHCAVQQSQGTSTPRSHSEIMAELQGVVMCLRSIGSLLASIASLYLLKNWSKDDVFWGATFMCVMSVMCATRLQEDNVRLLPLSAQDSTHSFALVASRTQFWQFLWHFIIAFAGYLAFVLFYNTMPSFMDTFDLYLYQAWTFPDWQYSLQELCSLAGSLTGAGLFWRFCSGIRLRTVVLLVLVINALLTATQLPIVLPAEPHRIFGMSGSTYVLLNQAVQGMCARLVYMPMVTLASQCAVPKWEATSFSVVMFVGSVGTLISASLSVLLNEWMHISDNDWSLVWMNAVICTGLSFVPLVILLISPINVKTRLASLKERLTSLHASFST